MSKPTDSQRAALKWLINRNGDGVFAEKNRQVLLASGERSPVMRATWTALEGHGLVERYMDGRRLRVTDAGKTIDLNDVRESR